MAKRVFYSFHYIPDCARVSQVRNIRMVEDNPAAHDNDWDRIQKGGDVAIQRWIDDQLKGRSCTVVMIGAQTAGRKWIDYEIKTSWDAGKGLVGVHIHNLKNLRQLQSQKDANPFAHFVMERDKNRRLANIAKTYDPPFYDSKQVYAHIGENLSSWIDEAIDIRGGWERAA